MKTDKLVYLLLQLAPEGFFALLGRNPNDAARYSFQSVEIKETAFRIDGVFIPYSDDDVFYFIEAQFQLDEQFYARFFAEIFLYLKQYPAKKWRAVAIYPSKSVEQKNSDAYAELLDSSLVLRVYLDELPDETAISVDLFKLLILPEKSASEKAKQMLEQANLRELGIIEQILTYKFSTLTREEIKKMLGIQRELLQETQVYKEIFSEGRKAGELEGRKAGELEGRKAGELEGRKAGELAAKLSTVPLLRDLGLPDETIAEKLNLPLETVKSVKT